MYGYILCLKRFPCFLKTENKREQQSPGNTLDSPWVKQEHYRKQDLLKLKRLLIKMELVQIIWSHWRKDPETCDREVRERWLLETAALIQNLGMGGWGLLQFSCRFLALSITAIRHLNASLIQQIFILPSSVSGSNFSFLFPFFPPSCGHVSYKNVPTAFHPSGLQANFRIYICYEEYTL